MKICVYGASGDELDPHYFEAAEAMGSLLARAGHSLVFGGGAGGLMGAAARGAVADGGEVIGIAPRLFDEPGVLFQGCSRFVFTDTLAERKAAMAAESDAFLALPGGIGTFEELFETLTLKQLGLHGKPVVLLNTLNYYAPLLALLEQAAEQRFLSRNCLRLFRVCTEPEDALRALEQTEAFSGSIRRLKDYSK